MIQVRGRHESLAIHGLQVRTVTWVTKCCSKRLYIAQIKRLSSLSDKGYLESLPEKSLFHIDASATYGLIFAYLYMTRKFSKIFNR